MRHIALDVHRDFCEVAVCEDGALRGAETDALDARTLTPVGVRGVGQDELP